MELHGQAMVDYLNGEEDAYCILRRDDGIAYPPIYARQFFYPKGLPELDQIAVERCAGRVLDIGAGAGSHSLAIQLNRWWSFGQPITINGYIRTSWSERATSVTSCSSTS